MESPMTRNTGFSLDHFDVYDEAFNLSVTKITRNHVVTLEKDDETLVHLGNDILTTTVKEFLHVCSC